MAKATRFQRLVLPGFAFKAVIIGGGYATGRELAEFFIPSGPAAGLLGMLLAMSLWSLVCVVTFLFAQAVGARDYRSFFRHLLGPFWVGFDIVYLGFVVLILAVFAAAAGSIGQALFGWPLLVGTLALAIGIAAVTACGNDSVERLFRYVTILLYLVYALFLIIALLRFGHRIPQRLTADGAGSGWIGGTIYASYNIIAAVVILPVLRHLTSRRDAVVAGALCGPLAMLPGMLFFLCMTAYYPEIGSEPIPSDFLLRKMNVPPFHFLFQIMIFAALLESGAGAANAVIERIAVAVANRRAGALSRGKRLALAALLLIFSVFLADMIGLVDLIARGYRALTAAMLMIYVLPLMTYGLYRLWRPPPLPALNAQPDTVRGQSSVFLNS